MDALANDIMDTFAILVVCRDGSVWIHLKNNVQESLKNTMNETELVVTKDALLTTNFSCKCGGEHDEEAISCAMILLTDDGLIVREYAF